MTSSEALLDDTSARWDFHDLAHQTTVTLTSSLYGTKFFSDLQYLPSCATILTRSRGIRTADKGPLFSDGLAFSELLTGVYTSEMGYGSRALSQHTYASLESTLATAIAGYLLRKTSLIHLRKDTPAWHWEQCVSISRAGSEQNLWVACIRESEMEQRVFVRGGPEDDKRDTLDKLNTGQRLKYIANNRAWMYFEVRNTIRHRAHKAAYRRVAESYQHSSDRLIADDVKLLHAIVKALDYTDWEIGGLPKLWVLTVKLSSLTPKSWSLRNSVDDTNLA